ncbi:hypothetical protein CEXT_103061 [Caerostris extrusa]|uniref:Uncharacterized protein n=1 Tax=Caerostris extrusa TaxID=172846 RepID=A0AAV4X5X4_CAEEX|nr:hypothetical protein CEXT_103061 [Caerostris extrusa]
MCVPSGGVNPVRCLSHLNSVLGITLLATKGSNCGMLLPSSPSQCHRNDESPPEKSSQDACDGHWGALCG